MLNSGTLLATRYRVTRKLGGGGMKMVYLVEDNRLANRPCALAEMIDSFTDPAEAQAAAQAFAREADLLAQLKHDHIVQVLDRFSEHNRHYLVMEYLEGETLEERIKSSGGKLDEPAVLDIALQILAALEYLHTRTPAVIYRDLKPSNVILTPDGRVKVIDFGIARLFVPQKTATMIGTQGFAPPEQYKGKVEPRSDLYALGATMHYLLSGRDPATEIPFSFPPIQQLCRHCNPVLAEIINEALAYDLAQRIPSAADFKRRLQRLANPAAPAPRFAPPPAGPVNPAGPGAPTVTGIVATQQCPRCARDIPADAVVCPYCSAQLKPPVPSRRRRWPLAAAGLLVIAGAAFGSTYYYEDVYLPRQAAIAQAKWEAAAAARERAAEQAAQKAVAQRTTEAQADRKKGDELDKKNFHDEALPWWRKATDLGDGMAADEVGRYYSSNRNEPQAAVWYRKSALLGYGEGAADLADLYSDLQDRAKANEWSRKAQVLGFTPQFNPLARRFTLTHDTPVYEKPSLNSGILAQLHRREQVHVTGIAPHHPWVRIQISSSVVGFIPVAACE